MQRLFVMQGAPGSGKSALAGALAAFYDADVCSADQYHVGADGVYRFRQDRAREAHAWCQLHAGDRLAAGRSVVIDNTNVRRWEAKPYVEMAVARGIPVQFVRCQADFGNIHGVPAELVAHMRRSLEDLSVAGCLASTPPWECPWCYTI